jgi:hypothetical protein
MNKIRDGISSRSKAILGMLVSLLFFPTIAFAYVDPGSGSVIVTTILGLIAAAMVVELSPKRPILMSLIDSAL